MVVPLLVPNYSSSSLRCPADIPLTMLVVNTHFEVVMGKIVVFEVFNRIVFKNGRADKLPGLVLRDFNKFIIILGIKLNFSWLLESSHFSGLALLVVFSGFFYDFQGLVPDFGVSIMNHADKEIFNMEKE